MNLQDIINPIGDLMTASFEYIIEPLSGLINVAIVVVGAVGLIYWLAAQKKYTDQARREGRTI
jgi:hypothetical protein